MFIRHNNGHRSRPEIVGYVYNNELIDIVLFSFTLFISF